MRFPLFLRSLWASCFCGDPFTPFRWRDLPWMVADAFAVSVACSRWWPGWVVGWALDRVSRYHLIGGSK